MITIILDNREFHPGQIIKGNIELVPDSQVYINDIELCFFYIEEWNYSKSETKKDKGNYKQCISLIDVGVNKFLPGDDNNLIRLDPIMHLFPFELKLPNFLFPSFEYPKHDYKAFLRYTLLAQVKSPNYQLMTSIPIFILSSSKKENQGFSEENTFNIKKWGMFGKGSTKIKASLPMKYFKFSDNVPVNVEIDNTLGKMKVKLVKINLVRKMILKDNSNDFKVKYSHNDKVMKKVFKVEVRSGAKENFDLYNWTRSYSEFIPSIESTILNCQYMIKVTVYFDSFLKKGDRPRIFLPIYIVNKLDIIAINNNINNNMITNGMECNDDEIKNLKQNDFVFDKNNSQTPVVPKFSYNKSKTMNQDNTYIDNMAYNKDKNMNQINNNVTEGNNNTINENFNSRVKTHIENNNINKIEEENQDQDEAPSIQFFNSNNNEINNTNKAEYFQKPFSNKNE